MNEYQAIGQAEMIVGSINIFNGKRTVSLKSWLKWTILKLPMSSNNI
jgi:hypothetical protein